MMSKEGETLTNPQAVGVAVGDLDPLSLKAHPAPVNQASRADGEPPAGRPGYVVRPHDRALAGLVEAALAGQSGRLFLVGEASTGKTRACWEALQPLAEQGWRLWHPCEPAPVDATLADLEQIGPRTVVWLYEAQHRLGAPSGSGERFSAALGALLRDPARAPVLVLGTLSPANHRTYVTRPREYPEAWDVLAGRTVTVPDAFDPADTDILTRVAASDTVLADALGQARNGQVAQYLAGAPTLLARFQNASAPARAVLEAAMDYVRLGVGPHLPGACLAQAAEGYLSEAEREQAPGDWFAEALAEATAPTGADDAPLRASTLCTPDGRGPAMRPGGPSYQPAPYLVQHAGSARRALCPPAAFWQAAADHLTDPHHLDTLARAALERHRLRWAERLVRKAAHWGESGALHRLADVQSEAGCDQDAEPLFRHAAAHGDTWALLRLAWLREEAGDHDESEELLTRAGDDGDAYALMLLAEIREEAGDRHEAERLARQAADLGEVFAPYRLAETREEAGEHEEAERLAQEVVHDGNIHPLYRLALQREVAGDAHGAERLYTQAADHGNAGAMISLAAMREKAGEHDEAERLARRAADHGDTEGLCKLAMTRKAAADAQGAERLFAQAAEHGDTWALNELAQMREAAGDHHGAERLAQPERGVFSAANLSVTSALVCLAAMRARAGDHESAERLARHAAHHGDTNALYRLAEIREEAGDRHEAERLALQAADHGSGLALTKLAERREEAGEHEEAERLARLAARHGDAEALYRLAVGREQVGDTRGAERLLTESADHGNTWALNRLAEMRLKAGDRHEAERLARRAADRGSSAVRFFRILWPHGLEADGTPSPPLR
ncbi:transcriptional regulator [Streptomyces sp. NPDC040724]|uniref:transcriptional regulator n=1 Tax=Streptomyces sp. NPDC040724 TaxID=3155612 RepID=UPI0033F0775B